MLTRCLATEQPVDVERSSEDGSELKHSNARRILTKMDLRILPILSLTYLVAFLDRVNIGNAAVFGAHKLSEASDSICLTVLCDRSQRGAPSQGKPVQCGVDDLFRSVHSV
jgi:hypothetical protein